MDILKKVDFHQVFLASDAVDWNPLGSDQGLVHVSKADTDNHAVVPHWWVSSPYIYIDASRKKEARVKVQGIIRQLNDLRMSGKDYSFELIIELYRICKVSVILLGGWYVCAGCLYWSQGLQ